MAQPRESDSIAGLGAALIQVVNDIVVLGAGSQLGQSLRVLRPNWQFLNRGDLDLNNLSSGKKIFSTRPKILINFAAYTQVDRAESEIDLAMKINGEAVGILAQSCEKFLHISTDYVFSGSHNSPYVETDATAPISVYGKSKLLGEQLGRQNNPLSIIMRTSWLYSEFGTNFMKKMLELSVGKNQLKVVNDQVGTPTSAVDLAAALVQIVEHQKWQPGIYHYSNSGQCTWYDFAKKIFALAKRNIEVLPIPTKEYPTPAKRPLYSVLDKSKITTTFDVAVPDWQASLAKVLSK